METTTTRRPPWVTYVVLIALLAIAGIVISVIVANNSDDTANAAQVASIQQGCHEWMAANPGGPTFDCSQMTDWMNSRMGTGGVGSSRMFGTPEQMRATCERWMTQSPPSGSLDPRAQCDAMVAWMTQHMGDWSGRGDWDEWMMHGPMMGG